MPPSTHNSDADGRLLLVLENGDVECCDIKSGHVEWMLNCGGPLSAYTSSAPGGNSSRPPSLPTSQVTSPAAPRPTVTTSSVKKLPDPQPLMSKAVKGCFAGVDESSDDEEEEDEEQEDESGSRTVSVMEELCDDGEVVKNRQQQRLAMSVALSSPATSTAGGFPSTPTTRARSGSAHSSTSGAPGTPGSIPSIPRFIPGYGTSSGFIYIQNGLELEKRSVDDFFSDNVLIASQLVVLSSSESVYTELRLSDGAIVCHGIDAPRIIPPRLSADGFGEDVILAVVRQNKVSKGRHRGAAWQLKKGNIVVTDVSDPVDGQLDSTQQRRIGPNSGSGGAPPSFPIINTYVNGRVEVLNSDAASSSQLLWAKEFPSPIIKAYLYSPALRSNVKFHEIPVQIYFNTPSKSVIKDGSDDSAGVFYEPGRFIFTNGAPPDHINLTKFTMNPVGGARSLTYRLPHTGDSNEEDMLLLEYGGTRSNNSTGSSKSHVDPTPHSNLRQSSSFILGHYSGRSVEVLTTSSSVSMGDNHSMASTAQPPAPAPSFLFQMFEPIRTLGRGACGKVILVRHRMTQKLYAIKMLVITNALEEEEVLNEVKLHEPLVHKNIVRYHNCWVETLSDELRTLLRSDGWNVKEEGDSSSGDEETDASDDSDDGSFGNRIVQAGTGAEDFDDSEEDDSDDETTMGGHSFTGTATEWGGSLPVEKVAFIQMEYCPQTLAEWMTRRRRVSRYNNLRIALQCVSAVQKLHENDIIHRDIKPTNIFMAYDDDGQLQIKLGDLGMAKTRTNVAPQVVGFFGATEDHTIGVGSPLYSSPEQLEGKECSPAVDIFALGVVLAELYTLPTTMSERHHDLDDIRSGLFCNRSDIRDAFPELCSVMTNMVAKKPGERLPLNQVKKLLKAVNDKLPPR